MFGLWLGMGLALGTDMSLLTAAAFDTKLASLIKDGRFDTQDASLLTGGEALSPELKSIAKKRLALEHFPDAAERDAILSGLGLTTADLQPSSSPAGLEAKLIKKLKDVLESEAIKKHDVKLGLVDGQYAGVDLRFREQLLAPGDPLIKEDKYRAATTAAAAASGEPVTWAALGGGIYPRVGASLSIPVAAGASVSFGFNASASLGYSSIAPYTLDGAGALAALKDGTAFGLPWDSASAREMKPGAEVLVRGTGKIAGNASFGIGQTLAQVGDFLTVGATFGSSIGASKELDLSLRIKRLDKDKVFISVARVDSTAGSISVGANIGVTTNLERQVPDLGGGLFKQAGDIAADQLDKQVKRWLNVDLRATHTMGHSEKEVTSYVLDLSQPAARAAYDDLVKLDFRKVDALVEDGDFSVKTASQDERVRTRGDELKGKFGPLTLLTSVSSLSETNGSVSTSLGEIQYDRVDLKKGYSGFLSNLFAGKREIDRQLVATKLENQDVPDYYYHVRHTIRGDGHTSKRDMQRFIDFADLMGALDPDTRLKASEDKFLTSFGKTDRTIDVYLNDAGLQGLAKAFQEDPAGARDTLIAHYAAAYERLDRPAAGTKAEGKPTPWLDPSHKHYQEVVQLCFKGPKTDPKGGMDMDAQRYSAITGGRDLTHDSRAFKASRALAKMVMEIAKLPDESGVNPPLGAITSLASARIHALAEADHKLGFDFWNALAALGLMVGSEQVLVNELSVKDDKKRELVLLREGAIQDPRAEIESRLTELV